MAKVIGGDIRQFKINGKEYEVPKDTEMTFTPNGRSNTHEAASGNAVNVTQSVVMAGIKGVVVVIHNGNEDLEALQTIRDAGNDVPVSVTLADTSVWSGTLGIDGDTFDYSGKSGHLSFDMAGSVLEQV